MNPYFVCTPVSVNTFQSEDVPVACGLTIGDMF